MKKLLVDSCKKARKRYSDDQISRALSEAKKEQSDAKKKLMEEIDEQLQRLTS